MARSCSSVFKEYWERKGAKQAKMRVQYKRRYYNGSDYVYENDWQSLEMDQFEPIDGIPSTLEATFKDVYKTQTFTLRLKNTDLQWLPTIYTPSIYAADAITGDVGYDGVLTKFRTQFAYKLEDGTIEYLTNFTGYGIDPVFDSQSGLVEFTLASIATRLEENDASDINDSFTQESTSPAAGDGTTKIFYTTSTGVERVTGIRKDSVAVSIGVNVTIGNLENPDEGAKLTFEDAPANGLAIDATGEKCKADQTIETIIGLLCDVGGIGAGQRSISTVLFPGGLSGSKTINDQADWENGTLIQNISTASSPGDILQKWMLYDGFSSDNWGAYKAVYNASISIGSGVMTANASSAAAAKWAAKQRSCSLFNGTFSKKINITEASAAGASNSNQGATFMFVQTQDISGDGMGVTGLKGYGLRFNLNYDSGYHNQVQLMRHDNTRAEGGIVLANLGAIPSGEKRWSIDLNGSDIEVFKDGVSVGSVSDSTYTSNLYMGIVLQCVSGGATRIVMVVDDVYWTPDTAGAAAPSADTATFDSEEFDLLANPTAWGVLERTHTLNSGTIVYETAVASSPGGSYDAWVAIAGDGTIQSALKRYFKIRATITPQAGSLTSPIVSKLIANFQTTTVYLALARHRGKKCWQMIQRYARLANYECGVDSEGILFFRPKTTDSEPVAYLSQEQGIESITDYRLGYIDVKNAGQVTHGKDGEYYSEYGKDDAGESEPTSERRFGKKIEPEDFSDILLAHDANIGSARARSFYEQNYRPRKTFRVNGKLIPWAEPGDRLNVTFLRDPKDEAPIFGDPLSKPGMDMGGFGTPENVLANNMDVRILGEYPNFAGGKGQYFVQEILT